VSEPFIDIVFDRRPVADSGARLLGIQDSRGSVLKAGAWLERTDGTVALRLSPVDILGHQRVTNSHCDAQQLRADFALEHPNCIGAEVWVDLDGLPTLMLIECGTPGEHVPTMRHEHV